MRMTSVMTTKIGMTSQACSDDVIGRADVIDDVADRADVTGVQG